MYFPEGTPQTQDPTFVGVFKNNKYQVSIYTREGLTWLAIVRIDREAIHDWRDIQRIKNELMGPEREACELYPAESRLVDTNNQFHLFVLPEGASFPFGYDERDVSDCIAPGTKHKQRPFEVPPKDLNAKDHSVIRAKIRTKTWK